MNLLDRYLLMLFTKIFMICFFSFTGLYIVVHLLTNWDELSAVADRSGGMGSLMVAFYGPLSLDVFDKLAGVLLLTSSIFALSLMQRRNELTALASAGISRGRVARPVFFAALIVVGLAVVNREVWIPACREQLVRSPQNWTDEGTVAMSNWRDPDSGILIRGSEAILAENRIIDPELQLPLDLPSQAMRITAQWAVVQYATRRKPDGLLLQNVELPESLEEFASVVDADGQTLIFSPRDHSWLGPRQLYVRCELDLKRAAYGQQMTQYMSLQEMIERLRQPRQQFGFADNVALHARILRPVLDFALLLVGLPLVITRAGENVYLAAGMCLVVVVGAQVTILASHWLGAYGVLRPPSLAAWLPVIILVPIASVTVGLFKR